MVKRCMLSALLSFMIPMIASHCSRSTSANQLLHASAAADLQIAILSVTCVLNLTTSIIVLGDAYYLLVTHLACYYTRLLVRLGAPANRIKEDNN